MLYLALPGFMELWPILVVLLLLFGAKKLPELARAMGSSINMFKKGLSEESKPDELGDGGASKQEPGKLESGRPAASETGAAEPARAREKQGESSPK